MSAFPQIRTKSAPVVDNQATGAAMSRYRRGHCVTQASLATALGTTQSVVSESEAGDPRRPWTEEKVAMWSLAIKQLGDAQ